MSWTDLLLQLAIFLLLFLVIAGAWLGFWVVHKLVLAEDGSIDIGVSQFVGWSIRVFASALILQVLFFITTDPVGPPKFSHFLVYSPYWSLIGQLHSFTFSSEFSGSFIGCGGMDMWSVDFPNLEEINPAQIRSTLLQVSLPSFFFPILMHSFTQFFCSFFIFSHSGFHEKQEFITNRHELSLGISGFIHITNKRVIWFQDFPEKSE